MLLDEEIFCTLLTLQCPSHSFHFLEIILDIIPVVLVVFFVGVVPWPPPPFHSRYQSPLTPFCVTYEALGVFTVAANAASAAAADAD